MRVSKNQGEIREWHNGGECFALAPVKAFSFLHRIRHAARPAGMADAARCDELPSDDEDGIMAVII